MGDPLFMGTKKTSAVFARIMWLGYLKILYHGRTYLAIDIWLNDNGDDESVPYKLSWLSIIGRD